MTTLIREHLRHQETQILGNQLVKEEKQQQRMQEQLPDDVRLLCKGCKDGDNFVCYASDIRCVGTNYINPDKSFANSKVDKKDHHDEEQKKRGIKKIYCKKCGHDWGNTFRGHPNLKLKHFKCEKDGLILKKCNQWSKLNNYFPIATYNG